MYRGKVTEGLAVGEGPSGRGRRCYRGGGPGPTATAASSTEKAVPQAADGRRRGTGQRVTDAPRQNGD